MKTTPPPIFSPIHRRGNREYRRAVTTREPRKQSPEQRVPDRDSATGVSFLGNYVAKC